MAAYVGSLRHGLLNAEDAVKKAEEAEKAMAAAARKAADAEKAAETRKAAETAEAEARAVEQEKAAASAVVSAAAAEKAMEEAEAALKKAATERAVAEKEAAERKAAEELAAAEKAAKETEEAAAAAVAAEKEAAAAAEEEAKVAAAAAAAAAKEEAEAAAEAAAAAVAAAEKAASEKALADERAKAAAELADKTVAEKAEADEAAVAAKAEEVEASSRLSEATDAADKARKSVSRQRRSMVTLQENAAKKLLVASEAAAVAESAAMRDVEAAEAEADEEKVAEAKAALLHRTASVKALRQSVVAAKEIVDATALVEAEEAAKDALTAKLAEKEPPTFEHLAEPYVAPPPEDPLLIPIPEMPPVTNPAANWQDFEKVVVDVAKATPGIVQEAWKTTVGLGEQTLLHPGPTRMVKRTTSQVAEVAEPVTKPLLQTTKSVAKIGADTAVAAYPHVKTGSVMLLDKSKEALEFLIPHVKQGSQKLLDVSGDAMKSTGDVLMKTPLGPNVIAPIDNAVMKPMHESVVKPIDEKLVQPVAGIVEKAIDAGKEGFHRLTSNDEANEEARKHNEMVALRRAEKEARDKEREEKRLRGEPVSDEEDIPEETLELPKKGHPSRMVRARKANAGKHRAAPVKPSAVEEVEEEKPDDGATHYVTPNLEQSDQVLEEQAAVAEAMAAMAAASETSLPVIIPDDWVPVDIIVKKATLSTKLGVVLTNVDDDAHPIVASIMEDGAVADLACQVQGELMAGDKILALSALTSIVKIDTAVDCKGEALATTALLKKAVGPVKFTVERAGAVQEVVITKPTKDDAMGIQLTSQADWKYPKVSKAEGLCSDLKVDDVVIAVEGPTEYATIETRHSEHSHLLATGFLKSAVGSIAIHIHRLTNAKKVAEIVSDIAAEALKEELLTTDGDAHMPLEVTTEAPEAGTTDRKASFVLSAADEEALAAAVADLKKEPEPEPLVMSEQVNQMVFKKSIVKQVADGITTGIDVAGKVIESTEKAVKVATDSIQRPSLIKRGSSTIVETKGDLKAAIAANKSIKKVTVVVNKPDSMAKLGVTFTSHPGDSHPVVSVLAEGGAASTKACQLQGVLMAGDKISTVTCFTKVVRLDTKAAFSATPTAKLLQKAIGAIKFTIEREHPGGKPEMMEIVLVKSAVEDKLGIDLVSKPGDLHPTIKNVVDRYTMGKAAGKLKEGDVIHGVQAAMAEESIGTNTTIGDNGNAASTTTLFLSSALGPITFEVLRQMDKKKRRQSVAEIYTGPGAIMHDTDEVPGAQTTTIMAEDIDSLNSEELEEAGLGGVEAGRDSMIFMI